MSEPGSIGLGAVGRRQDANVEVIVTARIPEGTHIESHEPPEPFLIPTVVEAEGLDEAEVEYPEPVAKHLGLSDGVLSVYEGDVSFVVRGRALSGADRVRGTIRYQPCVHGACLPPRTESWEAPLSGPETGDGARDAASAAGD